MWKVFDNNYDANDDDNDNDDKMDNGQILIRKAHLSLQLRWAKNVHKYPCAYRIHNAIFQIKILYKVDIEKSFRYIRKKIKKAFPPPPFNN